MTGGFKAENTHLISGARPAHDACFQDVNVAGNAFGNCGKDAQGNYVKCDKRYYVQTL